MLVLSHGAEGLHLMRGEYMNKDELLRLFAESGKLEIIGVSAEPKAEGATNEE